MQNEPTLVFHRNPKATAGRSALRDLSPESRDTGLGAAVVGEAWGAVCKAHSEGQLLRASEVCSQDRQTLSHSRARDFTVIVPQTGHPLGAPTV